MFEFKSISFLYSKIIKYCEVQPIKILNVPTHLQIKLDT